LCFRSPVRLCGHSFDISQYTVAPQTNGMIPTVRMRSVMFSVKAVA